ncbi:MBL fold metallo-hydrolase [Thermus oshimai]
MRYGFATPYHPDHAGLAEELKREGMTLLGRRRPLARWVLPFSTRRLTFAESRGFLASLGLFGEILPTPGHLDDGRALTGDLPPEEAAGENPNALASWAPLRSRIHPGHGPIRPLELE